jgi:alkylation response protein AidB-like acyl-CoA dehydrogenase
MRFCFTEEQHLVRSELRALLEREWPASALRAAWEADAPPARLRRRLAELGVLGIRAPERLGGTGGDELDLVLVLEQLGRAAVPGGIGDEAAVAVPLIAGDAAFAERWLPQVIQGTARVSFALDGRRYALDADVADVVLVEREGTIVAAETGQVRLLRQPSVDGGRRLFSVEHTGGTPLALEPGALALARDRAIFAAAAELLGLAGRMLDMAVAYARERRQFGRPIGSFQAVKHRLADALAAIELARPVVYAAAWSLARRQPDLSPSVALAKLYANRAADTAARHSLQVHGGIGFAAEHDLHLWLKRAKALEFASGDSATQLRRLADHLAI